MTVRFETCDCDISEIYQILRTLRYEIDELWDFLSDPVIDET